MTFGICGIAPSASHAVSSTHAPASARVRARAAKGRTHHTYQGIVQPRVRTVASMTKPAAPGSHARRHVTAAVAPTAASAEHGVGDDAIVGRQPTLSGERGEHVGHAQRPDEPVLDAGRRQAPAVEHLDDEQ